MPSGPLRVVAQVYGGCYLLYTCRYCSTILFYKYSTSIRLSLCSLLLLVYRQVCLYKYSVLCMFVKAHTDRGQITSPAADCACIMYVLFFYLQVCIVLFSFFLYRGITCFISILPTYLYSSLFSSKSRLSTGLGR